MARPTDIKEKICKRISDVLAEIVKEGKLARLTNNGYGIFIHNYNRSQFIKVLAEELLIEKEVLDAISINDLEHILFNTLFQTRNKSNIQDQAAYAAKLLLARKQTKKT